MPAPPPLSNRLVAFGGRVCLFIRRAARDPALDPIHRQLARSATSPAANYAEAREAVSVRDYVFKLKLCIKELRESLVWLQVAQCAGVDKAELDWLAKECNELIAITVTCVKKAKNQGQERNNQRPDMNDAT